MQFLLRGVPNTPDKKCLHDVCKELINYDTNIRNMKGKATKEVGKQDTGHTCGRQFISPLLHDLSIDPKVTASNYDN